MQSTVEARLEREYHANVSILYVVRQTRGLAGADLYVPSWLNGVHDPFTGVSRLIDVADASRT